MNAVIALAFILGYVSASPGPSQFERRVYVYERIPQAERLISRYGPGGLENEWRAIVRTDVISEEQAMRERQDLMPTMNVSISRPIKSRPVNVAQQVVDSRQLPSDQVQAHNRQEATINGAQLSEEVHFEHAHQPMIVPAEQTLDETEDTVLQEQQHQNLASAEQNHHQETVAEPGVLGHEVFEDVQKTVTVVKKVAMPVPIEKRIPVPVYKQMFYPVQVPVGQPYLIERRVPYPVKVLIKVPVKVPQPIPVIKEVPYPMKVLVDRPVPYKVYVPDPFPIEKKVHYEVKIPVPDPYPVERKIPVPIKVKTYYTVPHPVEKLVPYPVKVAVDRPVPQEKPPHGQQKPPQGHDNYEIYEAHQVHGYPPPGPHEIELEKPLHHEIHQVYGYPEPGPYPGKPGPHVIHHVYGYDEDDDHHIGKSVNHEVHHIAKTLYDQGFQEFGRKKRPPGYEVYEETAETSNTRARMSTQPMAKPTAATRSNKGQAKTTPTHKRAERTTVVPTIKGLEEKKTQEKRAPEKKGLTLKVVEEKVNKNKETSSATQEKSDKE